MNGGCQEGKIREAVVKENLLDAVIGLPANLFYGTGIPAAFMIFDKSRRPNGKEKVLFIDASREFEQGTNQNRLSEQDIEKIEADLAKTQAKMEEYLKELGFYFNLKVIWCTQNSINAVRGKIGSKTIVILLLLIRNLIHTRESVPWLLLPRPSRRLANRWIRLIPS
jgi:type I restriction-modification system DNA methylase subunit